ncbi:MAG TPA: low temperature requirement protein A [Hyphomicrobiaceae bacterium]|nr:low temperature requirement protein A [Hyphomicrobiaceae bacterium]
MVELFFDLVFVFAITQLSHALLADVSVANGLRIGVLLLAVWWAWIYTSWTTNWLDPDQTPVRFMLFVLMLSGLVMSAAIPRAFTDRGLAFALAFVVIQVGRTAFACWALRRHNEGQFRNFARIGCWLVLSGVFWIVGGLASGNLRVTCWMIALAIEYMAPAFGFWTPHFGRSTTRDWDIDPAHMAERCALFVIIALGESLLVTGATFAAAAWKPTTVMAFVVAVVGTIAMWWVYFNIGADEATHRFKSAEDPGRIARLAYTYLHLPIVAGIVVAAVADELVLAHPYGATDNKTAATLVGGPVLFIGGTLLFKRATAGRWPLSHLVGLGLLLLLLLTVPLFWPLGVAALSAGILVSIAIWETVSLQSVRKELTMSLGEH